MALFDIEVKEVASQLSCPSGELGNVVANKMHQTNIGMTTQAINSLNLNHADQVLEIGHGNAQHLTQLLDIANDLCYFGLDISELMHEESKKINSQFIETGKASFHLYNGLEIPFEDNSFNKIFTVNTLYFWSDPEKLLGEIFRVLKRDGLLSIAFGEKKFMQDLPFTKYGFQLYDATEATGLIGKTAFEIRDVKIHTEEFKDNAEETVKREYIIITAGKS